MNKKLVICLNDRTFILLCVLLATIAESDFFAVTSIDGIIIKYIQLTFVLLAVVGTMCRSDFGRIKEDRKFLFYYLAIVIVFLLVQFVYTFRSYSDQTVIKYIQSAYAFFWILLSFPLFYLFQKEQDIEDVLDLITFTTVISLAIMIITARAYNLSERTIFNVDQYRKYLMRNGRLRIWDLSSLEGLVVIWLFYNILYTKKKLVRNLLAIVVIFSALLYVEQTRSMQLYLILVMAFMYITKAAKGVSSAVSKICVVLGTIVYIVATGWIDSIIQSFSTTGLYASSTIIRLDEVVYSLQLFKDHIINGTGLVLSSTRDIYFSYTGAGKLGYTDIGIIGLLAQVGLWAIVIYILPICRFGYILLKLKKGGGHKYFPFLLGVFIFLVITSATLLVINSQRAYMWPFCIAIFEFVYYQYKENLKSQEYSD